MKSFSIVFALSIVLFSSTLLFSKTGSESLSFEGEGNEVELYGKDLFLSKCKGCHGKDGSRSLFVKKLTTSTKTLEEAITIITNGNGRMPAFNEKLSSKQIETLAQYIQTLKLK